jgi:hypothetical protein
MTRFGCWVKPAPAAKLSSLNLHRSNGYISVLENPDSALPIMAIFASFFFNACKLVGSRLLMGVALQEAVAVSVESTIQRAKDGDE